MTQKYNYKDDFEMLLVRHDYFSRIDIVKEEWFNKYRKNVLKTSKDMYYKYAVNFSYVGYDLTDVEVLCNCYMLIYMSLYSFETNEQKRDEYIQKFTNSRGYRPSQEDIDKKEVINMISFIRQKIRGASIVCERKSRNIIASKSKSAYFSKTKNAVAADDQEIFENYKKLGYRKITANEYKERKKENKVDALGRVLDKNNNPIFRVFINSKPLTSQDYSDILSYNINKEYENDPEESMINIEEDMLLEKYKSMYSNLGGSSQKTLLQSFIDQNKGKSIYKNELSTARKILRTM